MRGAGGSSSTTAVKADSGVGAPARRRAEEREEREDEAVSNSASTCSAGSSAPGRGGRGAGGSWASGERREKGRARAGERCRTLNKGTMEIFLVFILDEMGVETSSGGRARGSAASRAGGAGSGGGSGHCGVPLTLKTESGAAGSAV
jgi:hypothetical protein